MLPCCHAGEYIRKLSRCFYELHQPDVNLLHNNLAIDRNMPEADIQSLFDRPAYLWNHPAVRKKSKPAEQMTSEVRSVKDWLITMATQAGDPEAGRVSMQKVMQVFESIIAVVDRGELTGE